MGFWARNVPLRGQERLPSTKLTEQNHCRQAGVKNAGQWRRGEGLRSGTEMESRRPLDSPG